MAIVLVVDDEPDIRNLLKTIIEKAGHAVHTASDAGEAWALLEKRPDIIFADIDMPGETGVELVLRLRDHASCGAVPVIFVTAHHERAVPLLATGAGIVDVIDKPFKVERVLRSLETGLAGNPSA